MAELVIGNLVSTALWLGGFHASILNFNCHSSTIWTFYQIVMMGWVLWEVLGCILWLSQLGCPGFTISVPFYERSCKENPFFKTILYTYLISSELWPCNSGPSPLPCCEEYTVLVVILLSFGCSVLASMLQGTVASPGKCYLFDLWWNVKWGLKGVSAWEGAFNYGNSSKPTFETTSLVLRSNSICCIVLFNKMLEISVLKPSVSWTVSCL